MTGENPQCHNFNLLASDRTQDPVQVRNVSLVQHYFSGVQTEIFLIVVQPTGLLYYTSQIELEKWPS